MNWLLIIAIIIIGLVTGAWAARWRLRRSVDREVKDIFGGIDPERKPVTIADLAHLPIMVQRWLIHSGIVGKAPIRSVRIVQRGQMRLDPKHKWKPITAEHFCRLDEPAFIWRAEMRMAPFLKIFGIDRFRNGKGRMHLRLDAAIPLVESTGEELDQGTMVRFLDEMIWYPSMALSPLITWEEVAPDKARATFAYKGKRVSGIFEFAPDGRVRNFSAIRYMERKGQYSLEQWSTPMGDYRRFEGIEIPARGSVIWHLKTGDFLWLDMEIVQVEYNAS